MDSGVTRKILLAVVFIAAIAAVLLCVAYAHRAIPVYVVQRTGETTENTAATDDDRLDINKATREELEALPGIGSALADRVIDYRKEHGRFYDVGELREVKGIGDDLLEKLLPYICT